MPVWTGSSSVNFASGDTRANTTIVPVAQDGSIRLTTSTSVDVVADAVGYFDSAADGARYVALSAYRVVDTRWFGERELLPGETRTAQVVGNSSSSPTALLAGFGSSMRSVWLNSTVTRPSGPGWLTLWAGGSTVRPGTSGQNFGTGQTRANGFPVAVSVAGGTANSVDTITVSSGAGAATDWIVDVAGVFVAPSGSTPS